MLRDHWREFPQELHSFNQIPSEIMPSLQSHLPPEEKVLHLYLMPQQRGFWEWFHDAAPRNNVFCLTREEVLIAREKRDRTVSIEHLKLDDIMMFEVGTVLLNSWLKLLVANHQGLDEITFQYGTIFARHFRDTILWLRILTNESSIQPQHIWRMPGEDYINILPLKFNNAARGYWLHGETALGSCFIDTLRQPRRIYNRLFRVYSSATAIVISNQQICIISEQDSSSSSGRWGQIWRFCSLKRIAQAEILEKDPFPEIHFKLTFSKPRSGQPVFIDLNIPFRPEQRSEIEGLLKIIKTQVHSDLLQTA